MGICKRNTPLWIMCDGDLLLDVFLVWGVWFLPLSTAEAGSDWGVSSVQPLCPPVAEC